MAEPVQPVQPVQLALVAVPHNNQRLFSDHYLDYILPAQWGSLRDEAAQVMAQLQRIYAGFTPNASNEAQTEEDWIKPVLRALGHVFEVQAALKVPDGTRRPDYIFYRDSNALIANKGKTVDAEMLQQGALAVGDAKSWERPLDKTLGDGGRGSDPFNNKNPSFQIFFYMLYTGLRWGMLTNGRQWRLYHIRTAHKFEVFYEVDLPALLEAGNVDAFLYFYTFFRREAFLPGPLSLDLILSASTEYAQGLSDSLREQVYDALRYVAQGFLDYSDNRLEHSPETYRLIYDNSLILLYRLLFILYAEARGLLPLQDNPAYRRIYSLDAIKRDVVSKLHEGLILPGSSLLWTHLKELFKIINLGSPPLTVTTFNGGLFDPQRHPFLEQFAAGDLSLCRAIDKLVRVNGQFIDYRDLSERHLGTIYEGLLEEYALHVAAEPMVELRSSSKIVPTQGVAKREIAAEFRPGEVYLVTDRGERKKTGSYYTPDFIVKYMVDEALRPVLDSAIERADSDEARLQAVLAINVLDPSMGSGHFLVEVTEYIARYLIELGLRPQQAGEARTNQQTDEADLTYWKRRVAGQCIYGVDLNPLAVELAKLSLWLVTAARDRPLSFLDHHLRSGNALLGSWLSEVAVGQHPQAKQRRARQAESAEKEAGQLSLPILDAEFRRNTSSALDSIAAIEHNPGITLKDVKAQEAAYEELQQHFKTRYLTLANLGTALYYNLAIGSDIWRPLADVALGKASDFTQSAQFNAWLAQANAQARQRNFFHWELEFPNIFFDQHGQPLGDHAGFDVVIGNPPYVRQEQLGPDKSFFQQRYEVYHGMADLFVYFFAQGLRLLREDGRLAYISSNAWLRANYATPLRQHLRTRTTIESIVDLGDNRVFADAPDMTPSIQVVQKTLPIDAQQAQVAVFARGEGISAFRGQLADKLFPVSIHDQPDSGWQLTSDTLRTLFTKIMATGKPLSEVIDGQMYRGVVTGLNEAFIIDQATRDSLVQAEPTSISIIKPMLRGEDLRPWYQENEGYWLIFAKRGIDITAYPSVYAYLKQFREQLEPRPDDWDSKNPWHGRKPGSYKWYEIQDSVDYYNVFEMPKIFWPNIGKFPRFSWDNDGLFVGTKGFVLPTSDFSLLGILQSRVIWYCITQLCQSLGERAGLVRYQQNIDKFFDLPIPQLTDTQHDQISTLAQQLTETAQRRYAIRQRTTKRIQNDLGSAQAKLNQKLLAWWELPFKDFRTELVKVFKRDIPLRERDDWEELLRERAAEISRLTGDIVRLEIALNAAVYDVFGLNEEERCLIEQETKYAYGEW